MFKNKYVRTFFFLFTTVFVFTAGCTNAGKNGKSDPAAAAAAAFATGTPLFTYNGGSFTVEEMNAIFNAMPPMQRMQFQSPDQMKEIVKQLSEATILAEAARKEGLMNDPSTIAMIAANTNGYLASQYVEKKIKPLIEKIALTDADLKQYYDANPGEFSDGQIKASHILVDSEQEAKGIYDQVKKDPSKFAEIAKLKSKDKGSAVNGGDLGFFPRGRMVPEFEQVAFSLKKGEIAPPVKSDFGWHVIYVTEKSEVDKKPFESVKAEIENKLKDKKKTEIFKNEIEKLKTQNGLKVNEDKISLIKIDAPTMMPGHGMGGMGGQMPAGHPDTSQPPPPPPAGK